MNKQPLKLNGKKLTRKQSKKVFILFLAKLGFSNLSPTAKVSKSRQIVIAMTGNPNFVTSTPTLASVTLAADTLDAAQIALDGTRIKTVERNEAEETLDTLMSGLQGYVDAVSMKDEEKVLSSGFDLRNPYSKADILNAPIGLTSVSTQIEGQIKLKWLSSKGGKVYVIEAYEETYTPMPTANWQVVAQSSKATVLLNDLAPGAKYRIRVAVINTAGISGWSDETVCRPN